MNILHLTDFHFSKSGPKYISKQKSLCEAIVEELKKVDFDYIIFSGDLVYSGESLTVFNQAYELLIQPILTIKKMDVSSVFFCQGNHDVNRSEISKPFIKYIDEELKTNSEIDDFADYKNSDFQTTLKPSKNYYDFIKELGYPTTDTLNEMYTVHIRKHNNKTIGFISINSSWRSTGDDDENKLIYPLNFIYEALNKISHTDLKVIIHHHPLNYFDTSNQYELEDLIHSKFDISFFGHVHKGLTSIDYTPKTGLIKILSPASLKYHLDGDMGFSLVQFDFEGYKFKVKTYLYDSKQEFLYSAPSDKNYEIPTSNEVRERNSFRAKLRKLTVKEKDSAGELFVSFGDNNPNFEDIFVEPLLRKQEYHTGEIDRSKSISVQNIIIDNEDYTIIGDDKCGKTSLLKYINIYILTNYELLKQIPFYLDFSLERNKLTIEVFEKRLKNYYEVNHNAVNDILNEKGLILLIDNFDFRTPWQNELLTDLKENYPKTRIIITASKNSELIMTPIQWTDALPRLTKFENLKNKQVRALANNWTSGSVQKREEIIAKIDSLFKQLQIPFSFWNVSLFLWVVKKSGEQSIQNNVGLVDLYIESLLERENLIKTNANFDYEKYLKLLAYLSHFLLTKYKESKYSAPELEILNFIGQYLNKNPRNKSISAHSVWTYLKARGIFKKINESHFSFRLNGVFEYFLAYYMKLDPQFRNDAINDEVFYLSFKNEFEIYAGFSRDDDGFLKSILERTKKIIQPINEKYDFNSLDNHLKSRADILPNYERNLIKLSNKAKSFSFEEQEQIEVLAHELDIDSEIIEGVREKKPLNINQDEISVMEDSLFILGRVFRNIDEINSEKIVNEIFEYYLKSICQWGLRIIDTSKAIDFQTNYEGDDNIKLLYKLISSTIPLIVQKTATDHIIQKNLEGIILDRINCLKEKNKGSENQFELFVLYYILVDLDLSSNRKYIDDSINYIKIPVLKHAILLKLNNYLAFKTNEDKSIEGYLRKIIQRERLKLNNKLDAGDIQKQFEEQKKQNLLK